MRVIAGSVKGARLFTPKGRGVRPTLDRVRESLFSILMPYLEDARFLDLFAGTGANGVEALSRGAATCDFVDNDARSLELIRKNLHSTELSRYGRLWRLSVPQGLRKISTTRPYDVIFADPPYKYAQFPALFRRIAECGLLDPEGILVVEHDAHLFPEHEAPDFVCTRRSDYGSTALSFFTAPPGTPS